MNDNIKLKQENQHNLTSSTIRISPIKVPNGAMEIGNYILGKTIGSGTYGKVHLGLHILTGQKVAVKIIDKQKLSQKDLQHIQRQIQILKQILHPSLIQLYEVIQTKKSLLLVTQYMQNGQLFNYIITKQKLSENQSCQIFHQIIEGVQYMHSVGITHRDIKPQNILIDYNGKVKIIDFGLSNFYEKNQKLRTQCGSPCYAAPQMIEGKHKYDPLLVDIWSTGIVLFSMIAGYLPFCDSDISVLYKKILSGIFKFPTWFSQDAKDLISKMLVVDPSKRIKLNQIFQHPWYKKINIKKGFGIDPRFSKIPSQTIIVKRIQQTIGLQNNKLTQQIQQNLKTKQTAFYYILVRKLVRQNKKVISYFGSQYFDSCLVKPLKTDQIDNFFQSSQVVVQNVKPILPDQLFQSPITDSQDPLFLLKMVNLDSVLYQLMNNNLPIQQDKQTNTRKDKFYCFNLQTKKKRQTLKLQISPKTQIKKGKSLFTINKIKNYQNKQIASQIHMQQTKTKTIFTDKKIQKYQGNNSNIIKAQPNVAELRKIVQNTMLRVKQKPIKKYTTHGYLNSQKLIPITTKNTSIKQQINKVK